MGTRLSKEYSYTEHTLLLKSGERSFVFETTDIHMTQYADLWSEILAHFMKNRTNVILPDDIKLGQEGYVRGIFIMVKSDGVLMTDYFCEASFGTIDDVLQFCVLTGDTESILDDFNPKLLEWPYYIWLYSDDIITLYQYFSKLTSPDKIKPHIIYEVKAFDPPTLSCIKIKSNINRIKNPRSLNIEIYLEHLYHELNFNDISDPIHFLRSQLGSIEHFIEKKTDHAIAILEIESSEIKILGVKRVNDILFASFVNMERDAIKSKEIQDIFKSNVNISSDRLIDKKIIEQFSEGMNKILSKLEQIG